MSDDLRGQQDREAPDEPRVNEGADRPLLSWSFEPASADCNGWPVSGALAIRASPAHSGTYSCKVCANGSTSDLKLSRELGPVAPGRYALTAWVRKRALTAAPAEALARIEADTPNGAVVAVAPPVLVREAWDLLEATLELKAPASSVRVTVGSPVAEGERCLFIDDVTVIRVPG